MDTAEEIALDLLQWKYLKKLEMRLFRIVSLNAEMIDIDIGMKSYQELEKKKKKINFSFIGGF